MKKKIMLILGLLLMVLTTGCMNVDLPSTSDTVIDNTYNSNYGELDQREPNITLDDIPVYSGDAVAIVNNNNPQFATLSYESYEYYSVLDFLGRCGVAEASLGIDLMPTQERESISQVKPSGWQNEVYDIVEGGYLYNRCHLIGFQLAGENANEKNLITGTRYMNTPIMTKYENAVAEYIKDTGNHVMYRVTPMYKGFDLLPKGLQIEGYSVEDAGNGVCFNVFIYNEQPGITINHTNGDNWLGSDIEIQVEDVVSDEDATYVLNTSSLKIHLTDCNSVSKMSDFNKKNTAQGIDALLEQGYSTCGNCYK